jgi:hypothetical protein
MTYLELYTYITGRFALSLTAAQIKEHVNEIYRDLSRLFTPRFIETNAALSTVAHTATLDLTFDARKIHAVKTNVATVRTLLREVDRNAMLTPAPAEGTPKYWAVKGKTATGYFTLLFDPPPAAAVALDIDYEPVPAVMTADADIPRYIPLEYQYLIALGALAEGLATQEDWQNAQYWEGRYRDEVNQMILQLGLEAIPDMKMMTAGGGKK